MLPTRCIPQFRIRLWYASLVAGDPLPREARRLLRDHLVEIMAAWNALNPGRPIG